MSPCRYEKQYQLCIILSPNEKPIGFYVTLPTTGIISDKFMRFVFLRQGSLFFQNPYYVIKKIDVKSAFAAKLDIFKKLSVKFNLIHKS